MLFGQRTQLDGFCNDYDHAIGGQGVDSIHAGMNVYKPTRALCVYEDLQRFSRKTIRMYMREPQKQPQWGVCMLVWL